MDESVFDSYVCGVTGSPCCGCSLYCEHRRPKDELKSTYKTGEATMKYAVTLILSVEVDDEVSPEDIKKDIAMAEEQIGWNYWFSIQDINVDVN